MRKLHLIVTAILALGLFSDAAIADPGNTWDKVINNKNRFVSLKDFDHLAVLDKETGRVWERSPTFTVAFNWFEAQIHCTTLNVANRLGWRLPTIQELASLVDPTQANVATVALPPEHPFENVQAGLYWSATSVTGANTAWMVFFEDGDVRISNSFGASVFVWCVRGGQGVDVQ